MEWFLAALELIGTAAFAVSGAMVGMKKNMDVFGIITLGLVTAVGGGVIRDLILGITPPTVFRDPTCAILAVAVSMGLLLPPIHRGLNRSRRFRDFMLFLMDSVGLGVFTVIGVRMAFQAAPGYSLFLALFVGVMTGVGGGVLRDVLAGNTPYIFVKHIYACASILGGLLCVVLWPYGSLIAMLAGATLVLTIRCLSAYFRWSLPKPGFVHENIG